jgi:hypothetical protein
LINQAIGFGSYLLLRVMDKKRAQKQSSFMTFFKKFKSHECCVDKNTEPDSGRDNVEDTGNTLEECPASTSNAIQYARDIGYYVSNL